MLKDYIAGLDLSSGRIRVEYPENTATGFNRDGYTIVKISVDEGENEQDLIIEEWADSETYTMVWGSINDLQYDSFPSSYEEMHAIANVVLKEMLSGKWVYK